MIEIQTELLYQFILGIGLVGCTIVTWAFFWVMLAGMFEYPDQPSWKTAVPAALIVIIPILIAAKVIVFV